MSTPESMRNAATVAATVYRQLRAEGLDVDEAVKLTAALLGREAWLSSREANGDPMEDVLRKLRSRQ